MKMSTLYNDDVIDIRHSSSVPKNFFISEARLQKILTRQVYAWYTRICMTNTKWEEPRININP